MLLFGELMGRGWRVPEKESTVAGAKRRRTRNKGWLLPFFHNDVDGGKTNRLTYRLETKRLTICVSLGFFGEGLKFVRGCEPPPRPEELDDDADPGFDLVSRAWVARRGPGAVVFTQERVKEYIVAGV